MKQYYPDISNTVIDLDEEWINYPEGQNKNKIRAILDDNYLPVWKYEFDHNNRRRKNPLKYRLFNLISDDEGNSRQEEFESEYDLPEEIALKHDIIKECQDILDVIKSKLSKGEYHVLELWGSKQKPKDYQKGNETFTAYKSYTLTDVAREMKKALSTVEDTQKRALKKIQELENYADLREQANDLLAELPRVNNVIPFPKAQFTTPADLASKKYPCGLMEYLRDSFNDNESYCPGSWQKQCHREAYRTKDFSYDNPIADIKTAVGVMQETEYKVRKLCSNNHLPHELVKSGKTRKIIVHLSRVKDCGQNIWRRADWVINEERKQQYREWTETEKFFKRIGSYGRKQMELYFDVNKAAKKREEELKKALRLKKELDDMEKEQGRFINENLYYD